jgi:glutathione synthase/RimK-type ligase-like ATP-grasp enzyme
MAKTKLPIHIYRGSKLLDEQTVMIGEAYVKRLKLPTGTTVTLRFGAAKREVRLVSVSGLAAIRVSESLASYLGLTNGMQLCVSYRQAAGALKLGPIIGVLIRRVFAGSAESPFGAMTGFCREMTEACRTYGGYVCFFTPDDLPGTSSVTMSAWTYQGRWVKRTLPVPDIVYNRLTTRKSENAAGVQQFMKDVKGKYGASVFNEKYLDKTEVFAALRQDPGLRSYLPESHLFKNYVMLKTMLDRHGVVFLKPITGSLGKGIIRVSKHDGAVVVHSTHLTGVRRQSFAKLTQAFQSIAGRLKQQKYQIQQGLRLLESGDRPLDFRALVHKGGTGEWGVTSTVARIAAGGDFVSNVARGGTLSPLRDALAKTGLSAATRAGLIVKLKKAAVDIAKGVESRIPAHFGELGIDLAADHTGKVWLLEVNSKPSKDDNTPLTEGKIRPSVRQLIEYSQHLAKY